MRVLFVYPNVIVEPTPQMGIASLSATLKAAGHSCDLYDTTFIAPGKREEQFISKTVSFDPQLIAISCHSLQWDLVKSLLAAIRDRGVPVVIGGPHPTVAPEEVIEKVDMLITGEGEAALLELVRRLEKGQDITGIQNLWVKKDGVIYRNGLRPFLNMDELEFPDWSLFDRRHFTESYIKVGLKRIKGLEKAKVIGSFETSRGCPYDCTYCINAHMQALYKGKGKYHREKSPERLVREMVSFKREYGLDFAFFIDDTFLLNTERLRRIVELYREVSAPFGFMARPEGVTEERMELMASIGAKLLSIGIETGDEEFREKVLRRKMSQQQIIDAFRIARKYGFRTLSFNMIGLPFENRNLIKKTMELNRIVQPDEVQVTVFYPFRGTKLQQVCQEEGFLDTDADPIAHFHATSVLNLPNLPRREIARLRTLISVFAKSRLPWWLVLLLAKVSPLYWLFENSYVVWHERRSPKRLMKRVGRKILSWLPGKHGQDGSTRNRGSGQ